MAVAELAVLTFQMKPHTIVMTVTLDLYTTAQLEIVKFVQQESMILQEQEIIALIVQMVKFLICWWYKTPVFFPC